MAWPLIKHPTIADYLSWAQKQGCSVNTGYAASKSGRSSPTIRIVSSDNKRWAIVAGNDQKECLTMTTIARLDRRLGIKSNFFDFQPEQKN